MAETVARKYSALAHLPLIVAALAGFSSLLPAEAGAGTLQIGTADAEECIEICRGVGYDCTTNNFDPVTKTCTIISDDNPPPVSFMTIETASAAECDELAAATGSSGSWDSATKTCTIGLVYLGCFVENPGADPTGLTGRVLNGAMTQAGNMTNGQCVAFCGKGGFRYAGTQFGTYCFCGTQPGTRADMDTECSMKCPGDSSQKCGAAWRNSIHLTHGSGARDPGDLGYVGCYAENPDIDPVGLRGRVMNGSMLPPDPAPPTGHPAMTTALCTNHCKGQGYTYAGTQFGSFCFCGNAYDERGISPNCTMTCSGASDEICGGSYANSVYRVR